MSPNPLVISIEGNIGSGKSTLLRELRQRNPAWHFVDEPVDSWMSMKNDAGESLLSLFYADKRRWAYTFQNTALLTRILALRSAIEDWVHAGRPGRPIFVTERCIQTDAKVFATMLHDEGVMDGLEWTLYTNWFAAFSDQVPRPAGYLYVDTPPAVCAERIVGRHRAGEGGGAIPLEYLRELDAAHTEWLGTGSARAPVLFVDNSSKDVTPIESVEQWVERQWLGSVD